MKTSKIFGLFMVYLIYFGTLVSEITAISDGALEGLKKHGLVEFSLIITSNSKPEITELIKSGRVFVARLESEDTVCYFNFQTNKDVQDLIDQVNENDYKISLYYVDIDIEITVDGEVSATLEP